MSNEYQYLTIIPMDDIKKAGELFKGIVDVEATLLLVILGDDSQAQKTAEYAENLGNTVIASFKRNSAWVKDKVFFKDNLFNGMGISVGDSGFSIDNIDAVTAFSISPDKKEIRDIVGATERITMRRIDKAFFRAGTM